MTKGRQLAALAIAVVLAAAACVGGSGTLGRSGESASSSAASVAAPTALPSPTPSPTPTPEPTPVPTPFVPYTLDEQTRYEGTLKYDCDVDGCWRQGSQLTMPSAYYYPDPDATNADIDGLLAAIGLPTTRITDDATAWSRMRALWAWLHLNARDSAAAPDAWTELWGMAGIGESGKSKSDHWPSISDFGRTYAKYHVIPWLACNSKALTFATLAYRVGFDPDRLAVAYFKTADSSIQHFYGVLRLADRWFYIDPSCNSKDDPSLPTDPASVGCIASVDYPHPFTLAVLPHSKLTRAMLVK